jgi:hypothetical protein
MIDHTAAGMVRCMDCARQTHADKGGRMRPVCTAEPGRPSLVPDKWRRCDKYVQRKKK